MILIKLSSSRSRSIGIRSPLCRTSRNITKWISETPHSFVINIFLPKRPAECRVHCGCCKAGKIVQHTSNFQSQLRNLNLYAGNETSTITSPFLLILIPPCLSSFLSGGTFLLRSQLLVGIKRCPDFPSFIVKIDFDQRREKLGTVLLYFS